MNYGSKMLDKLSNNVIIVSMNKIINLDNTTARLTVSLPAWLYQELKTRIKEGQVSSFVARAVERALLEKEGDPIEEFIALRKVLPKIKTEKILRAIKKGRI